MQDDNQGSGIPDGLPVWVSDPLRLWSTLRVAQSVSLGRLEWKWRSRGTLHRDSSTSARVSFRVSSSITNPVPQFCADPCDWFRNPYVFIYVTSTTALNHTDEDASSDWGGIRAFVNRCREKSYEYLFILAATEKEVAKYKRVVEKLRAEISITSRAPDRLLVLSPVLVPEPNKPMARLPQSPAHQELLMRIHEILRVGVDARIMAYEDVLARSYLSRSTSSWTISKYFALKEGFLFIFLHLGRRDLCLRLYDEIYKVMNDLEKEDFNQFCDQPAADIAIGATNPDAKDYRSIMLKGTATELDLRTYLFARQATLLLYDRKFSEVAERGLKFITVVARRCAEEALSGNRKVSAVYRDTWVFVASRLLSSILAPSIPTVTDAEHSLTAQLATPRERHTARLVAGFHVNALKAFQGLAHVVFPGCLCPISTDKSPKELQKLAEEAMATSSLKLRSALSSEENAQVLHTEIANAAASLYEMGGRARGAAALDGDSGIVRLKNKNFAQAETLLSAQCSRFTNDNGWDDLHKRQRMELAKAEKTLDKVQEYLVSCLAILYMHRECRVIAQRPSLQDESSMRKQVEFWASETQRTGALLSRVMKYKAERLFDISVLPNPRKWYEGDRGTATVRIKSDIPVSISIDLIQLECRCVDILESKRPSLKSLDKDEVDQHTVENAYVSGIAEKGTFHAESFHRNSELSDVVVLKCSSETLVRPGVNDIVVTADEIPRAGCYKITLVALFMGNLKLVHVAAKEQSQQVVIMKDDVNPSQYAEPVSVSEVIDGEVIYPPLFAAPRLPSASLEFTHIPRLFLVGNALQYLEVKIKAGVNGLRKGSKLCCTLHDSAGGSSSSKSCFVQFGSRSVAALSSLQKEVSITHHNPRNANGYIEFDIENALDAGEEVFLRFGLMQHRYHDHREEPLEGEDEYGKRCFFLAEYSCFENRDQVQNSYDCQVEIPLVFSPMLNVSARLETRPEWYEEDGSRTTDYHTNTAEDGGTLLCSVQSLLGWEEEACITKIALEIPQWLTKRREDPILQSQLLPSVLRGSSLFVCSFDLLIRDFLVIEENERKDASRTMGDIVLRKDLLQRRLSRKIFKSPDIAESQDDFGEWRANSEQASIIKEEGVLEESDAVDNAKGSSENVIASHVGNEFGKVEEDSHSTQRSHDDMELKEARDVVDLSTPVEELHGASSGMLTPPIPQGLPMSATTATLKLDLKISGVDGDAYVEQKISLAALRVFRKRYRIERRLSSETETGKAMNFKFAVLSVFGRFSGEDEKHELVVLHYEIDADPSVWLVVGRRRGQMMISDVMTGKGNTTIIPLRCGRHRVPNLRLYTSDGRGLPLSTYENVDEYMQIIIRPCRAVVNCCAAQKKTSKGNDQKADAGGSRGTMPEVVASDSFFAS